MNELNQELINVRDLSSEELVEIAGNSTVGTPSGMKAQAAQAELLRRNTEALKQSSKSSDGYALNVLALTVFLFAITGADFILNIFGVSDTVNRVVYGLVLVVGIVYVVVKGFQDDPD